MVGPRTGPIFLSVADMAHNLRWLRDLRSCSRGPSAECRAAYTLSWPLATYLKNGIQHPPLLSINPLCRYEDLCIIFTHTGLGTSIT